MGALALVLQNNWMCSKVNIDDTCSVPESTRLALIGLGLAGLEFSHREKAA